MTQSRKPRIVTFLRFVLTMILKKMLIYSCNITVITRALLKVVMDSHPAATCTMKGGEK